jgi:hypothetical protein
MGMAILTVDRAVDAAADAPQTAGGTVTTAAKSTPTFLSTESLTFPGVSLVSLGLVQIWGKASGTPPTSMEIAVLAGALGLLLIVWGLLGTTNDRRDPTNLVGQVIVGLLNTALLYGVMLGVTTG